MCAGEEMKQGHKSCMGICVCMQAIPGKKEDDTGIPDMVPEYSVSGIAGNAPGTGKSSPHTAGRPV